MERGGKTILPSRRPWRDGDIFGCRHQGRGVTDIQKPRDAAKHPAVHRTAPTPSNKSSSGPKYQQCHSWGTELEHSLEKFRNVYGHTLNTSSMFQDGQITMIFFLLLIKTHFRLEECTSFGLTCESPEKGVVGQSLRSLISSSSLPNPLEDVFWSPPLP